MEEFLLPSKWIWTPEKNADDEKEPYIVLFRKSFSMESEPESCSIKISADTKYKLYVNGKFVNFGPARGDKSVWFYDAPDITEHLKKGANVIAVSVLRYPEKPSEGNHGMFRTAVPGLYFEGKLTLRDGSEISLDADSSWKCAVDTRTGLYKEEQGFAPLYIHENACGDEKFSMWQFAGFDDSRWAEAKNYLRIEVSGAVSPGNLSPRPIPFLYRKQRSFSGVMAVRKSSLDKSAWEDMLSGKRSITIPAHSNETVEINAGEEMTGFIRAAFCDGKGAEVKLIYAETYYQNGTSGTQNLRVKKDRMDFENGYLSGYSDTYKVCGFGDNENAEEFLPFWFRTFRFVRLEITTENEPLEIKALDYEETGYPLEMKSHVETSDESLADIWKISERTLRRCMHETYEDCPYYEQLQYAMDSRQQILYTYSVSADDRLARQCISDLRRGQRADGLINCCYPNCNTNVIPGFSLYYILMVHDHMMYFGDKELILDSIPCIEKILRFFHRSLTPEGYVGKVGGILMNSPFWSFIDWAKEWNPTSGMPPAGLKGPLTMESLLYVLGLQHAASLCRFIGRNDQAEEYEAEAESVKEAVLRHCTGSNGMITDGPGVEEYSQQCQVFAVLTGCGEAYALRENLERTLKDDSFVQCTIAMRFYLFRALEKTGLYAYTDKYLDAWRNMLKLNCSTCIESEDYSRSECHAWGSLVLYELPAVVLGVRPAAPGYSKIAVNPAAGYLTHAHGSVITPKGMVNVSWELSDGEIKADYTAPEGVEVVTC